MKIYSETENPITVLSTSGTVTVKDYSYNKITPSGNVVLSLPTITDTSIDHNITIDVNMSTLYSFDCGTDLFFNDEAPDMSQTGTYKLIYKYDSTNSKWKCGTIY